MTHENRLRSVQNIMLTGGTCMIPGFKKRFLQELKYFMSQRDEFEELKNIV